MFSTTGLGLSVDFFSHSPSMMQRAVFVRTCGMSSIAGFVGCGHVAKSYLIIKTVYSGTAGLIFSLKIQLMPFIQWTHRSCRRVTCETTAIQTLFLLQVTSLATHCGGMIYPCSTRVCHKPASVVVLVTLAWTTLIPHVLGLEAAAGLLKAIFLSSCLTVIP